ncbi:hypothetical protein KR093_003344 [Drosophila rubida]|uniref:Malate dehydrogenase n=1 Tax=Drosophila rubida TaxID=30044 RepID=A0AAD4JSP1_9MUSC|nr:hypothetical protein KR093_003344 [Drosophila rubida]
MRRILGALDKLRKVRVNPKQVNSLMKPAPAKQSLKKFKQELRRSESKPAATKRLENDVVWQNLRHVSHIAEGEDSRQSPASGQSEIKFETSLVDVLEVQRFVSDVFAAMHVPFEAANEMADALIAADYMGQPSLGIHRLPAIADDLHSLRIDPRMQPKLICEREALALVDGQNAPGPVVANFCMDLAMKKARSQTIGLVAARHSNHIGMPSWYACQALSQRMLGICMSNGPPILVPSGGTEPLLGANSMAFAAANARQQLIMSVDASAYPVEQLQLDYCNGHLQELPPHVALDSCGRPTTNVADALQAQRLLPFAPDYKASGLAAMIETLCGVMTGARYAAQLGGRGLFCADQETANLGQVYIAIDPQRFCASFEERLGDFQQLLRNVLPSDPNQPPLIPGDLESRHMQMVDDQGGLLLSPSTLYVLQELSERFSVSPLVIPKGNDMPVKCEMKN